MLIKDAIKEYNEILVKEKELKNRKNKIKAILKTEMAIAKTDELNEDSGRAFLVSFESKRLDSQKVKDFCEETGQDYDYFTKEIPVTQLKVESAEKETKNE